MQKKVQYVNITRYLILICAVVALDQIAKIFVIDYFKQHTNKKLLNITIFLDFVPVWNKGIGLGIFNKYQYVNEIFIFVNIVIMLYFTMHFFSKHSSYMKIATSFIIAGGISNIIDRIFREAVFDFIWLNYHNFSFPVFNIADGSITLGAIIFIMFFVKNSYFQK